jgi:hypothetical protein
MMDFRCRSASSGSFLGDDRLGDPSNHSEGHHRSRLELWSVNFLTFFSYDDKVDFI